MMEEGRIVVAIETQTFRFTPSSPIDHQDRKSTRLNSSHW